MLFSSFFLVIRDFKIITKFKNIYLFPVFIASTYYKKKHFKDIYSDICQQEKISELKLGKIHILAPASVGLLL